MTPNAETMALMQKNFNTLFNRALALAPSHYRKVAMVVPSTAAEENYGWLASMPAIREWVGSRIISGLMVEGYKLRNLEFEATVEVRRTAIEDDNYGVYAPLFEKMGADAARHPDKLTLGLLKQGFASLCYDGQNFFDTDHPVGGAGGEAPVSVSNMQDGAGPAWFLLDCSQALKPLIFQNRLPYQIERVDQPNDDRVFFSGSFFYGVRARCNAGFGMWQLAFASKATLNATNYAAARAAMMNFNQDNGEPLGVMPTHLLVPPSLEAGGLQLLNADRDAGGATNVWNGTAELVVTPYVK